MILTVAIVNFNGGKFLEEAICSVLTQIVADRLESKVELVVVDGGSGDNSVEIIKRYERQISWWVSEPDRGQSDAFNKAFAHANGKYVTWVNSDDLMIPGCLKRIVQEIESHPTVRWFTGNFVRFYAEGEVMEVNWGPHWYPRFLQHRSSPVVSFGPATIFDRSLLEELGGLDVDLHFIMDLDLWLRFMRAGIVQRRINCYCWAFRMHDKSKTASFGEYHGTDECHQKIGGERRLVRERYRYRMNPLIRVACLALRVFDGSFVRKWILTRRYLGRDVSELHV